MIHLGFTFRPGAFGLPARGDVAFAVRTRWSNSDFGIARSWHMIPLNLLNSEDALNCSGVNGGGCVSPGLASNECLERTCDLLLLAGQLFVSKSSSDDMSHSKHEALNVVHIPVVVAKGLLIDIPEQVGWLNRNIGPVNRPFQETPEVLYTVRMNIPVHVGFKMVDNFVSILRVHTPVARPFVGKHFRSRFHVITDDGLHCGFRSVLKDRSAHRTSALQHPHNDGFPAGVAAFLLNFPLAGRVHIASLAADESLIDLDFSAELVEGLALHRKANPVEHKPCGFLGNADGAVKFPGGDAILAVQEHPDCRKPLFQRNWGVLKDRPGLESKARFGVRGVALPDPVLRQVADLLGAALRTLYLTIRPPQVNHKLFAMFEIREVQDRVSKGGMFAHDPSMRPLFGYVKYIIAKTNPISE